jgi:hypothetical protein
MTKDEAADPRDFRFEDETIVFFTAMVPVQDEPCDPAQAMCDACAAFDSLRRRMYAAAKEERRARWKHPDRYKMPQYCAERLKGEDE